MASYTEKLNLLKKNPVTDGADTFNIETMMNENWDKIDGFSAFLEASIAPPYSASSAYAVGAWCTYCGKLYQCTTAIGSGGEAWNANHWTAKNATDLAKDAVKTFVRPNLLDNAYFVGGGSQQGGGQFPINNRRQTRYTTEVYTIDRWWLQQVTASSLSIGQNYITLTATNNDGLRQELGPIPDGKQYTFSVLSADGVLRTKTFVASFSSITVYDYDDVWKCAIGISNGKFFAWPIVTYVGSAQTINLVAVKLELGPTQTLAHQENGKWVLNEIPNYTEQLLRCSRGEQIDGADSGATLPLYRQEAFVSSDTVPAINGAINWTYV